MKKSIYSVLFGISFAFLVSGIVYAAISFSAMSIRPMKWTAEQRDLFAFAGIALAGLVGTCVGGAVYDSKEKK